MVAEILRWKRIRACVFSVDAVPSPSPREEGEAARNNSKQRMSYDNV